MLTDSTSPPPDDPVREPILSAALNAVDREHTVSAESLQRLEQRVAAVLSVSAARTPAPTPVPRPDAENSVTNGLVLCLQRTQRWAPAAAVAAAAAVLVALSMTPPRAAMTSVSLVAYAGGRTGAALLADQALRLNVTPAQMLGKGAAQ
ncbi:hypothetical protein [Gemmatimonas groenlandica]|uniref:Uncharacterized protein n=1 Tax=Gemmatimonas groenlandica TaxID=2732249 RepID=A0A6M4IRK1_9BACT|nr:hypothetical protein [Gemmatimonas groenlandica]QJR36648.1 hypothetical protein HKW67_14580 [Gemmatimonas groenlandica]